MLSILPKKTSIWVITFFQFIVTKSLLRWWIWSRPPDTKSACSWVVLGKVERGLQGLKPSWRLTVLVRGWRRSQVNLKRADVICSWETDNSIFNQDSTQASQLHLASLIENSHHGLLSRKTAALRSCQLLRSWFTESNNIEWCQHHEMMRGIFAKTKNLVN